MIIRKNYDVLAEDLPGKGGQTFSVTLNNDWVQSGDFPIEILSVITNNTERATLEQLLEDNKPENIRKSLVDKMKPLQTQNNKEMAEAWAEKELDKYRQSLAIPNVNIEEILPPYSNAESGIELIANERWEQINKHGRTVFDDVVHNDDCELSRVARYLALVDSHEVSDGGLAIIMPDKWNFDIFKSMMKKSYRERLIIAGALLAAELDRIIYLENENIVNEHTSEESGL